MPVVLKELLSKDDTGREMYRLTENFHNDIKNFSDCTGTPLNNLPLEQYFNLVKQIPYRKDITGIEVVTRPIHLFLSPFHGWDCKKKAIAIASYLKNRNIPYRFRAVSSRPDGKIHHVFPQAYLMGKWRDLDATYPHNKIFHTRKITNSEILPMNGSEKISQSPKLISLYGYDDFDIVSRPGYPLHWYDIEYLGIAPAIIPLIAAGIAAVGGITASVISAVSQKKAQERATEAEKELYKLQQEATSEYSQSQQIDFENISKILLPVGLGIAGIMLLRKR